MRIQYNPFESDGILQYCQGWGREFESHRPLQFIIIFQQLITSGRRAV